MLRQALTNQRTAQRAPELGWGQGSRGRGRAGPAGNLHTGWPKWYPGWQSSGRSLGRPGGLAWQGQEGKVEWGVLALRLNLSRNCTPLVYVETAGEMRGFDSLGVFISLTYLHILNTILIFYLSLPLPPFLSLPLCLSVLGLCVSLFSFLLFLGYWKKKGKEKGPSRWSFFRLWAGESSLQLRIKAVILLDRQPHPFFLGRCSTFPHPSRTPGPILFASLWLVNQMRSVAQRLNREEGFTHFVNPHATLGEFSSI